MFRPTYTKALTVTVLGMLMVTSPGDTARLPRLLCDVYRGLFLFYAIIIATTAPRRPPHHHHHPHHHPPPTTTLITLVLESPIIIIILSGAGCVDRHTHICGIINKLLTRVERGRPACDYFQVCCRNLHVDGDEQALVGNSTVVDDMTSIEDITNIDDIIGTEGLPLDL
ncbi:hypothetical protein PoB_005735600 [Plakobranchus ocellatus]|uniref:Uncharacterized protein n=1 Tax=Plakobranchus ocellatus TaxID=259542 RepID=A0AAV4C699_9GAST|nr:hypothetical protein PoB_005735600 [Plakobranchus ocellatus]